jgi:hypothetical protein
MMVEGIVKDIRFGSARFIGGIAREVSARMEAYYGLQPDFQDPAWHARYGETKNGIQVDKYPAYKLKAPMFCSLSDQLSAIALFREM